MSKAKTSKELYEKYKGSFITVTSNTYEGLRQGVVINHHEGYDKFIGGPYILIGLVSNSPEYGWKPYKQLEGEETALSMKSSNYPKGLWWVKEDEIIK